MLARTKTAAAIMAAAGLCLLASAALAQPAGVTKDEFKCELGAGKALVKFTGSKSKCIAKCIALARKTGGPYTGCFAPYADTATFNCINAPLKGAEDKARAAIVKGCTADCPECYPASECTTGEPFVSNTESQLDVFGPLVDCDENLAITPGKAIAKCEDTVGKSLVKFVGAKSKCYQKCNANAFKGTVPAGACTPPATDPPTVTCINLAESKAAASIDKLCKDASPNANPPCYTPNFDTGAKWVALSESSVDAQVPIIGCGSPSSAFLD